jgi:hypothetical protein
MTDTTIETFMCVNKEIATAEDAADVDIWKRLLAPNPRSPTTMRSHRVGGCAHGGRVALCEVCLELARPVPLLSGRCVGGGEFGAIVEGLLEHGDDGGVELRAGASLQLGERLVDRHGRRVWAR